MSPTAGDDRSSSHSWSTRLLGAFSGPRQTGDPAERPEPGEVLPPEKRKAAMSTLDEQETKWSLAAFLLAMVAGIAIPAYITASNKVTKHGKNSIAVAPDAWLLGGAIIVLSLLGLFALWRRKRTVVAFDLFLIGFGFTLFVGLVGFVFILLGAWLMLRAWRLNKYGTTNTKTIAQETSTRSRGKDRRNPSRSGSKSAKAGASGDARQPPAPNKRYTPKSPPRKKIPKPTQ